MLLDILTKWKSELQMSANREKGNEMIQTRVPKLKITALKINDFRKV